MAETAAVLEARGVEKSFGGVRALRGVSLTLRAGEVHALVGENGAGKSTLLRIITGALQPDAGELRWRSAPFGHHTPAEARRLGIACVYQQPQLFPHLSVAENLAFALEAMHPWHTVNRREWQRRAETLLERVGANFSWNTAAGELAMPQQQILEIAKAIEGDPALLILDEPTASLGEGEAATLFRIIRELRERGTAIVYVSHRLSELFSVSDRITVLRDGASVGSDQTRDLTESQLVRLMVGRDLQGVFPARGNSEAGQEVLDVRGLRARAQGLHAIDLTVREGEVLGLAGLVGSGRTELAETLFGLRSRDAGTITIGGALVDIRGPVDAIRAGLGYVPEDRRRHGVVLPMSVAENTTLASLRGLLLDERGEIEAADEYIRRFSVRTPSAQTAVEALSGGNQQKVAIARWLRTKPRVLILDEPTQGVDVGAKAEIYSLIAQLAAEGMAILMISSDLSEVLGMSDRVAVMRSGTIAGILPRSEADSLRVMALAFGTSAAA